MQLKNKVALVTGSSVRVGKTIALKLASGGAKIGVHYRLQKEDAEKTCREIEALHTEAISIRGDISKKDDWLHMKEKLLKKWGQIDILVNNAAIFYRTPFFEITEDDWNNFLNINLKGTYYGCQVIGEVMYQNKSGKIINIADVSSQNVWSDYIPYCISKAGVVALTKGLSKALAPFVTVNAISPGTVLLADNYDEQEENYLISRTPLKRVGQAEDIANSVAFLIEGSDFITGEIINVDGGRSLT